MIDFLLTATSHVLNLVLVFSFLNACVHLRDICDALQELTSISYHVSEIRRRLIAIEKRMAKEAIKTD